MKIIMISLFVIAILGGFLSDKNKKIEYLIMGIYFILAAFLFTSDSTYCDYQNYLKYYLDTGNGSPPNVEFIYVFLMKISNYIGMSFTQFRFVIILLQIVLINSTFKRYGSKLSFVWAVFLIFPGLYLTELLRYATAVSILIFGIRYLIEDKKFNSIKYLLTIIIAYGFHKTFLFFILLLFIKFVKNNRKKTLIFYSGFTIMALLAIYLVFDLHLFSASNILKIGYLMAGWHKFQDVHSITLKYLLYNLGKIVIMISWAHIVIYLYNLKFKTNDQMRNTNVLSQKFMNFVIPLNYSILTLLIPLSFARNSNRFYYFYFIANIIATGICLVEYPYKKYNIKDFKIELKEFNLKSPIFKAYIENNGRVIIKLTILIPVIIFSFCTLVLDSNKTIFMLRELFTANGFINFFNFD